MRAQKSQAGVMLIEALVGILIFSIGILALIGMQALAIKNTTDARYRSEAAFLATEIAGRMWVDIGNLAKYDKDYGSAYAARDDWVNKVAATLPGIDLAGPTRAPTIEVAGNEVTITIEWLQPGETSSRKLVTINRINGTT
jgi:type IV pilus assembly protein PilV